MLRDAYPSPSDEGDSGLLQGLLTVCSAYTNHHTRSADIGSSSDVAQVAECYIEYYRHSVSTTVATLSVGFITAADTKSSSAHPNCFTNNTKVSRTYDVFHDHILKCLIHMYMYILIFTVCLY